VRSCSSTAATPPWSASGPLASTSRVPTTLASSSFRSPEDESARQSARPRSLSRRRTLPSAVKIRLSGSRNEPGSSPEIELATPVMPRSRSVPEGPPRAYPRRAAALRALVPTTGELERDHARAPGPDQDDVLGEVLLRVPERAVVARVDGEVAVVAPAALDLGLRTGARVADLLRRGHLTQRVAGGPARVAHGREVVRPRGAVAEGDVAVAVLGDAAHPPPEWVRRRVVGRVGALLVDGRRPAARDPHLVPADARVAVVRRLHRVVEQDRRVEAEAPVRQPEHQ